MKNVIIHEAKLELNGSKSAKGAQSHYGTAFDFEILLAESYGMCFGVREAILKVESRAALGSVSVLGELAHNPLVKKKLRNLGVIESKLNAEDAPTREVFITAHGASEKAKNSWRKRGYELQDATCPLVHRAHRELDKLRRDGCKVLIVGKKGHEEVVGLSEDYDDVEVIENIRDIYELDIPANYSKKIGIISQTTQACEKLRQFVKILRLKYPKAEFIVRDTICRPTKLRQKALVKLAAKCDLILVVGGKNSNNTKQLAVKARSLACPAIHIADESEICANWFCGLRRVGVSAGTSTLAESVAKVVRRLEEIRRG